MLNRQVRVDGDGAGAGGHPALQARKEHDGASGRHQIEEHHSSYRSHSYLIVP